MKRGDCCADLPAGGVLAIGVISLFALVATAFSQSPSEARVTVVVHDVKLLPESEEPRAAKVDDTVDNDTGVRTGADSRSELTFLDLTITRLGSNTIFSFNRAGRSVELNAGSVLLRVPKNSGGANIKTDACSVAITGTTLIVEVGRKGANTLAVLEGSARMALNKYPNESAVVHRGQLLAVPFGAKKMPKPINFDIKGVMRSHPLITNFPPLPSENEILAGAAPSGGGAPPQNPVVYNPAGSAGNPGGGYSPGGNYNPPSSGSDGRPNYPKGGGNSPKGGNAPNGPVNPGKGKTGRKGKQNPNGPLNPNNGNNPGGVVLRSGGRGSGQKSAGGGNATSNKSGNLKGNKPVVNSPKPSGTPHRRKINNNQQQPVP